MSYPIAKADVKTHCRISGTGEDDWIDDRIKAVTRQVEKYMNRQLITASWYLYLDEFPSWKIKIDKLPVASITEVIYYDTDGVQQTLDNSKYLLDAVSEPARLTPAYDESWPDTRTQNNAVKIEFVAGYGSASDVPEDIKTAMMFAMMHYYRNRGDEGHRKLPKAFFDMLDQNRVNYFK